MVPTFLAVTVPLPATSMTVPAPPASSVPTGWIPVESPLEGQSKCQELLTTTSTECSYQLNCSPDALWVKCSAEGGDALSCACSNQSSPEFHEYTVLSDTDLETACRASISLCNGSNAPERSEPACEETSDTQELFCSQLDYCTTTVETVEGVVAVETTPHYGVECSFETADQSWCYCPTFSQGITVHGASVADACSAVIPMCRSELPVGDDTTCAAPTFAAYDYFCSAVRNCATRTNLAEAGDVYATTEPFTQNSYCSSIDETNSDCNCIAQSVRLNAMVETSLPDACFILDDVCHSGVPLHASDTLECGAKSAQAVAGGCTASATCAQQLSNGNGTVLANAELHSTCEPDGADTWSCVCSGGGEPTLPEVTHAPNALRACFNAIDQCALRATVEVGPFVSSVGIVFSELTDPVDAGVPVDPVDATAFGDR